VISIHDCRPGPSRANPRWCPGQGNGPGRSVSLKGRSGRTAGTGGEPDAKTGHILIRSGIKSRNNPEKRACAVDMAIRAGYRLLCSSKGAPVCASRGGNVAKISDCRAVIGLLERRRFCGGPSPRSFGSEASRPEYNSARPRRNSWLTRGAQGRQNLSRGSASADSPDQGADQGFARALIVFRILHSGRRRSRMRSP